MCSSHATNDWVSATALNAADSALAYAQTKHARLVSELKEFIRFASISAQPKHANDLKRCAVLLAGRLRRIGMERVKRSCLPEAIPLSTPKAVMPRGDRRY
jgi:acetylornithine deacetylase/succinyl-diaminopimelate desuccinylase-like protein